MRPVLAPLLFALTISLGCAARRGPATEADARETRAPDAAALIAQEAVDARVTMLVHVDRLRGFRFARLLVPLGGWDVTAASAGIDAFNDVRAVFVASHASHDGDVALVLEHTAPQEQVAAALAGAQRRWLAARPAARKVAPPSDAAPETCGLTPCEEASTDLPDLARFQFPAAYLLLDNEFSHTNGPVLIAAPHPGLIVMLPPRRAFAAFRMIEGGGLPAPKRGEAMVFRAWEPERSIQNGPPWSPEVRFAEAVFTFDETGSSTLDFRAVCSSAKVAREQASVMTSQVEEAQTLSVGGAKLRLFDYIEFRSKGDRVQMRTRLFEQDVEWLVGMSMKPL